MENVRKSLTQTLVTAKTEVAAGLDDVPDTLDFERMSMEELRAWWVTEKERLDRKYGLHSPDVGKKKESGLEELNRVVKVMQNHLACS
jgi:hypothetical protein